MCVICISAKGIKQPSRDVMQAMWNKNPHGAGYMFSRSNYVYIKKGFMTFESFYDAVQREHFTKDDTVVYHFRISTQGGVNPGMTHPFMLTDDIRETKVLHTRTNIGICHNGIISLTTKQDREYSDTAHFIAEYLPQMISKPSDLQDKYLQMDIEDLILSKMVFLDYKGRITKIGQFFKDSYGLEYSNLYFYRNWLDMVA